MKKNEKKLPLLRVVTLWVKVQGKSVRATEFNSLPLYALLPDYMAHLTKAEPQVKPPPKAESTRLSPFLSLCW